MYTSLQEIKDANRRAGYHWFDTCATGFFGSRYGSTIYGGRYFISSEPFAWEGPRVYTIREALPDGSIDTVSLIDPNNPGILHNHYETRAQAVAAVKRLLVSQKEAAQ